MTAIGSSLAIWSTATQINKPQQFTQVSSGRVLKNPNDQAKLDAIQKQLDTGTFDSWDDLKDTFNKKYDLFAPVTNMDGSSFVGKPAEKTILTENSNPNHLFKALDIYI